MTLWHTRVLRYVPALITFVTEGMLDDVQHAVPQQVIPVPALSMVKQLCTFLESILTAEVPPPRIGPFYCLDHCIPLCIVPAPAGAVRRTLLCCACCGSHAKKCLSNLPLTFFAAQENPLHFQVFNHLPSVGSAMMNETNITDGTPPRRGTVVLEMNSTSGREIFKKPLDPGFVDMFMLPAPTIARLEPRTGPSHPRPTLGMISQFS